MKFAAENSSDCLIQYHSWFILKISTLFFRFLESTPTYPCCSMWCSVKQEPSLKWKRFEKHTTDTWVYFTGNASLACLLVFQRVLFNKNYLTALVLQSRSHQQHTISETKFDQEIKQVLWHQWKWHHWNTAHLNAVFEDMSFTCL